MTCSKSFLFTGIFTVLILFVSFSYSGCSNDVVNSVGSGPTLFGGYSSDEAGVSMTLAALAYTQENNPSSSAIKDSLVRQLSDITYSTRGRWKLVWGPGLSISKENMMYVAADTTGDTAYYSIVIRGTDFTFPANIKQDMEVWNLLKYPFGTGSGDSVAQGSLYGLDTLLSTVDPVTNQNLQTYLTSIPASGKKKKMFITGHSLGGALATLVSAWFIDEGFTSKFALEVYTFASPSVGNQAFVTRYHNIMVGANAQSHRVVNTKDLVPYGWARLNDIVPNNIPIAAPFSVFTAIFSINYYLTSNGIVYKDVESKQEIGFLTPTNCPGGGGTEDYFCWVAFEHASNNYLRLLGADTIKFY